MFADTDKLYYFDYASATPPSASILNSFALNQEKWWTNTNSAHGLGLALTSKIDDQKKQLASLLSVRAEYINFFPSATICNNTAIFDIVNRVFHDGNKSIYYSPLEHPSIIEPLFFWAKSMKVVLIEIPLKNEQLNFDTLEHNLDNIGAVIVSANMSGSGILNDTNRLKNILKGSNVLWHCDISSLVYNRLDNLGNFGPSHITLSAKKIYGLDIAALITNGIHYSLIKSSNNFAGTPSYSLIYSFRQAVAEMTTHYAHGDHLAILRDKFEDSLFGQEGIKIIGQKVPRLANYSFLNLSQNKSDYIIYQLSKKNIMIGADIACKANLLPDSRSKYNNTLRVTFGYENTQSDVSYLSQNLMALL